MPESIQGRLATVSQHALREVVAQISVTRTAGTPANEAVRRSIIELFSDTDAGRLGYEECRVPGLTA